ncbi:hypothetical protein ACFSQ7_33095 [Paenibacillus rhizoplanae]
MPGIQATNGIFDNRDSYLITEIGQQTFAEEFSAKVYGVLNLFELLKKQKKMRC